MPATHNTHASTDARNELIEAFKDTAVFDAIVKALMPAIVKVVEDVLERKFAVLQTTVSELQQETDDLKLRNVQLAERLSALESYVTPGSTDYFGHTRDLSHG